MKNPFEKFRAVKKPPIEAEPIEAKKEEMPELGYLSAITPKMDAGKYYYELFWTMGRDGYEPWIGAGEETINTIKRDTAEEAKADLENIRRSDSQRQQERINERITKEEWENS